MDTTNASNGDLSWPQQLYVDGKEVPAAAGSTFKVTNPMTGRPVFDSAAAGTTDYENAINAAQKAFTSWSKTPPSSRRRILLKAADILDSYLDGASGPASEILSAEVSAVKSWVELNVRASANFFRDSASLATMIKGEILPADRPNTSVYIFREPVGVVFSICPWNAPLNLTARALATPLICGNTVVLKPSENSPKSQYLVIQALIAAGLPPGVINYLPTAPADAAAVAEFAVKHPLVRRVNFTGSDRVGAIIAGWAASVLKPCIFELGGKAPVIVLDNASVADAVNAVVFGGFNNSGQICMSTEWVIVERGVAETFKKALIDKVKTVTCGNHLDDPDVNLSGLYSPASAQRILGLIKRALEQGAKLLYGDLEVAGPNGTIMKPHVLDQVTMDMEISRSETFGPVLCLHEAASAAEAVDIANSSEYTLCAGVFSRDLDTAMRVAKEVRAGSTHVNGPTLYIEPPLPNGGLGGRSGYGRFGGIAGVKEFTDKKVVSVASSSLKYGF